MNTISANIACRRIHHEYNQFQLNLLFLLTNMKTMTQSSERTHYSNTKTKTVRISKEGHDWLIEQSKTVGVTVSGLIRLLIDDAYAKIPGK
jgi:hypothetical protein